MSDKIDKQPSMNHFSTKLTMKFMSWFGEDPLVSVAKTQPRRLIYGYVH